VSRPGPRVPTVDGHAQFDLHAAWREVVLLSLRVTISSSTLDLDATSLPYCAAQRFSRTSMVGAGHGSTGSRAPGPPRTGRAVRRRACAGSGALLSGAPTSVFFIRLTKLSNATRHEKTRPLQKKRSTPTRTRITAHVCASRRSRAARTNYQDAGPHIRTMFRHTAQRPQASHTALRSLREGTHPHSVAPQSICLKSVPPIGAATPIQPPLSRHRRHRRCRAANVPPPTCRRHRRVHLSGWSCQTGQRSWRRRRWCRPSASGKPWRRTARRR